MAELFERHYTLVQLAVHPEVGSQEKIDAYMSGEFGRQELSTELGYRFSQELFKHYLAERERVQILTCCRLLTDMIPVAEQYHAILSYSNEYHKAVSDFLRRNERHDLAWVQFLETGDMQEAGEAAFKAGTMAQLAHSQKILLSVVKLTQAARKAKGERTDEGKLGCRSTLLAAREPC